MYHECVNFTFTFECKLSLQNKIERGRFTIKREIHFTHSSMRFDYKHVLIFKMYRLSQAEILAGDLIVHSLVD